MKLKSLRSSNWARRVACILPKLEKDGLVLRRSHKNDQRRVVVSLAAKGRRLFDSVAPQSEAIYAALAQDIGAQKIEQIYGLLDEVIALAAPRKRRRTVAAQAQISAKGGKSRDC
jgi:DNA-binding PadR family transcriptional regulator